MSEANNYVCFNVDQSGNHSEPTRLRARNNIGAAGLSSLAASFESRAPSYNWSANEVCTYGGKLWMFDSNHSGDWTGADVHEISVVDTFKNGIVNGGHLVDGATITIPKNNSLTALSTSRSSATLELNISIDELPNFCVQITNSAALTLYVKINVMASPIVVTYAAYSSNAGQELEACAAGEINQVTCVGGCWTWAKFLDGSPSP